MKVRIAGLMAAILLAVGAGTASAAPTIGMELNKLESRDNDCRAYLLFDNGGGETYSKFKLDLILFDKDGIITKRVALDAAPLKADKTVVKVFDISGAQCDAIGKILINEMLACSTAKGEVENCINRIRPSTKAGPSLTK